MFPILKDILVFTQLYEQPFLLYLALLRETPRDGRRDEEIRLNEMGYMARNEAHATNAFPLSCQPPRVSLSPSSSMFARPWNRADDNDRVHTTANTEAHPWTTGTLFVRSFVIRPDFSQREKAEWKPPFGRFYISWRSIAIGADIQDKDRPVFCRA